VDTVRATTFAAETCLVGVRHNAAESAVVEPIQHAWQPPDSQVTKTNVDASVGPSPLVLRPWGGIEWADAADLRKACQLQPSQC